MVTSFHFSAAKVILSKGFSSSRIICSLKPSTPRATIALGNYLPLKFRGKARTHQNQRLPIGLLRRLEAGVVDCLGVAITSKWKWK
ncbi:Uncharacterized protein TCM_034036 [Theobroma cacao]|uniref:Uncharacterized protein n=1 Tax=Theobroma cacao TaxID=3641 RepID=A0A061FCJ5_THECC|nr:Uncharacterized protein TCM_034036 [Theobroma cacao]